MSIPFIDLKAQYRALQPQIQARINAALEHGQYIMGPEVRELEERRVAILNSVREQGKLDAALEAAIMAADSKGRLEDIYLPFKPKRRTKAEVEKDLPAKIEQEIIVPLAEEQSKLYKQMTKQIRDSLLSTVEEKGIAKAQIQILAALTRLRQVVERQSAH